MACADRKFAKSDIRSDCRTMSIQPTQPVLPTVSQEFIQEWLDALHGYCPASQVDDFLTRTGLNALAGQGRGRVTHDQIVRLYHIVAVETGDEMMGLWSRTIRHGALKLLCCSVLGASSLAAAMHRFATFWNLLLDDHSLRLSEGRQTLRLHLEPSSDAQISPFGHVLLLKLAHGVASWLVRRELPLTRVGFTFVRPDFAADYPVLFPAPIQFDQSTSSISFVKSLGDLPISASEADMQPFLQRAPRDWIFTSFREHALPLQLREMLLLSDRMGSTLNDAALALNITPRTLIRQLKAEGTSFQAIKDGLRCDLAMRDLASPKNIEAISQDVGFASPASFHRAFRGWTGETPGQFRRRVRG
ncbi:AraC family transcriptional regulator [Pelagimonas varians]|uniref:HTH araC/xylS-type domain-containing protein n=2 Tax=Pelagimonas varians TaxID=696760 RepID=A0A238KN05_9RHOB|nr:AraC family transcriptional regulator [Pelagimonas varians]SMX44145.1 hypothetical protein PEV8663_02800 [Pelagimonas varians]